MPGKGNGGGSEAATAANGGAAGNGSQGFPGGGGRGLDSGLAKSAPSAEGLNQKSLKHFAKQCARRNRDTSIEGAYLAISLLQDSAWEATEQLDLDEVELAEEPFSPIWELLDKLYQYEDLIEVPSRCEEFFQEFMRLKNEVLQAYILRHGTMMKKMKEVHIEIPKLLAGWRLAFAYPCRCTQMDARAGEVNVRW